VQPVGELDEHDADVVGHRQEHLSDVLCLLLLVGKRRELAELGDPVDELGDLAPEAILDVGQAVLGVLGDVMEDGGLDRDGVHAELGEDLGRPDRVRHEGLARGALLPAMCLDREVERAPKGRGVRVVVVLDDRGDQVVCSGFDRRLPPPGRGRGRLGDPPGRRTIARLPGGGAHCLGRGGAIPALRGR